MERAKHSELIQNKVTTTKTTNVSEKYSPYPNNSEKNLDIRDFFDWITGIASFSHPFPINSAAPFKLDKELSSAFLPKTKSEFIDRFFCKAK